MVHTMYADLVPQLEAIIHPHMANCPENADVERLQKEIKGGFSHRSH